MSRFNNPYTFVPVCARDARIRNSHFAGDYDPSDPTREENHSRYWPERYTGTISLKLTAQTPIFIPKTPETNPGEDHKIYDCQKDVPATAIKGMLRSAYEAITNSRFGVFSEKEHTKRLGARFSAEANLVPGRVNRVNGEWKVTLFTGRSGIGPTGAPATYDVEGRDPMPLYAAWIPEHPKGHVAPLTGIPPTGTRLANATVALCEHGKWNDRGRWVGHWKFWRVIDMTSSTATVPGSHIYPDPKRCKWQYILENGGAVVVRGVTDGIVVRSGLIFPRKHDERLFFNNGAADVRAVRPEVVSEYNDLLADYRQVHEKGQFPAQPPANHGGHIEQDGKVLERGDFVYVELNHADDSKRRSVKALYPVQISRGLHPSNVWDSLDEGLRPAKHISRLSPADRLFGWVCPGRSENGEMDEQGATSGKLSAWQGKVRFSQPETDTKGVAVHFGPRNEVPLSILGQPKPAQARFYLGDERGDKPRDGEFLKKDILYDGGRRIRGRKFYWHHKGVSEHRQYWGEPWQDRPNSNVGGYCQEYRFPEIGDATRTKQNRSIKGWLPIGTEITVDLRVENLTAEEVGALLTLTELDGVLKLGYGKPLGLGSVHITATGIDLCSGSEWNKRYEFLTPEEPTKCDENVLEKLKHDYRNAMVKAYVSAAETTGAATVSSAGSGAETRLTHNPFSAIKLKTAEAAPVLPDGDGNVDRRREWENLPFIKAFLQVSKGPNHDLPVRYPRTKDFRKQRNPESQKEELVPSYEWFVANDKVKNGRSPGLCLPEVWDTEGLPLAPQAP